MKKLLLSVLLLTVTFICDAANLKGVVFDASTKEPLIGVTVYVKGTTNGDATDLDGRFVISNLKDGPYTIIVSYISYATQEIQVQLSDNTPELQIGMESDNQQLDEVVVTARRNMESERVLQAERQQSTVAIENLGAKEMSIKGISNVQEGVKKITGISIAPAGQLIVRGLGDRYSITTLNGLPIASPNPDNKLIPLDLFPASTVQNITVSKVYDAASFADYSGAHINISTKNNVPDDFFQIGLNIGGAFNTIGRARYQMDYAGTLFRTPSMDKGAIDMPLQDFDDYAAKNNIFRTSFLSLLSPTLNVSNINQQYHCLSSFPSSRNVPSSIYTTKIMEYCKLMNKRENRLIRFSLFIYIFMIIAGIGGLFGLL